MSWIRFALCCGFFLFLQFGCASPWKRTTTYSGNSGFLFEDWQEDDGKVRSLGYSHPAEVSEGDLLLLLNHLQYENEAFFDETTTEKLLTIEEAGELAKALRPALAKLSPDERARFLVVRKVGKVIPTIESISGIVFQKGTVLNFAFDGIREPVRVSGNSGRAEDVTFPHDPQEKALPRRGLVTSLAGTRLRHDPRSGEVRRGWVEVDVPTLKRSRTELPEGAKAVDEPAAITAAGASEPDPGAPSKSVSKGTDLPSKSTESPETTTANVEPQPTTDEASLQEMSDKLKRLKALRDQGALTPEEYRTEYERILKEL